MGNAMTKAVDVVQRVAKKVKDSFRKATRKAAEVVIDIYYRAKDKAIRLATRGLTEVIRFSINHPKIFRIMRYVVISASISATLAPICLAVVLPWVGFTSGGVAAGSLAAAWQATIGNVAAGSLFAILTSAGAGGFGVGIVLSGLAVMGTTFGVTMAVLREAFHGFGGGIGPGSGPAPAIAGPGSSSDSGSDSDSDSGADSGSGTKFNSDSATDFDSDDQGHDHGHSKQT